MNLLHYKGYTGEVEFDAEASVLFGRVLGTRDVVTFEGESVAEVEQAPDRRGRVQGVLVVVEHQ